MTKIIILTLWIIAMLLMIGITFIFTVVLVRKVDEEELNKLERDNEILRSKLNKLEKEKLKCQQKHKKEHQENIT